VPGTAYILAGSLVVHASRVHATRTRQFLTNRESESLPQGLSIGRWLAGVSHDVRLVTAQPEGAKPGGASVIQNSKFKIQN